MRDKDQILLEKEYSKMIVNEALTRVDDATLKKFPYLSGIDKDWLVHVEYQINTDGLMVWKTLGSDDDFIPDFYNEFKKILPKIKHRNFPNMERFREWNSMYPVDMRADVEFLSVESEFREDLSYKIIQLNIQDVSNQPPNKVLSMIKKLNFMGDYVEKEVDNKREF